MRLLAVFLAFVFSTDGFAAGSGWGEIKDKHFVVTYESKDDKAVAEQLLRKAEEYYRKIGDSTGYSRTNKMWTWDDRVQIFLFASQASYQTSTGQPAWSTGYADRDSRLFKSKTIATFRQENNFIDGLLPHEISHLILHDFIGDPARIPVWLDEGVAQLQEKDKREMARGIMRTLTASHGSLNGRKQYIPFSQLVGWNIRGERDPMKVQLFYAQSLSVVDYLVTAYGVDAFGRLCRQLRDNKNFEAALTGAYPGIFKDVQDLERKWALFLNH